MIILRYLLFLTRKSLVSSEGATNKVNPTVIQPSPRERSVCTSHEARALENRATDKNRSQNSVPKPCQKVTKKTSDRAKLLNMMPIVQLVAVLAKHLFRDHIQYYQISEVRETIAKLNQNLTRLEFDSTRFFDSTRS